MSRPADLTSVLSRFTDPWAPRTVATLNDDDVRLGPGQLYVEATVSVNTGDAPGELTAHRRTA